MSLRARLYLLLAAVRNGGIGMLLLTRTDVFRGGEFASLDRILPLWLWGTMLGFGGLHLLWCSWFHDEPQARLALGMSAVFCAMFACAWAIVAARGQESAVIEAILFGTLAGKDLLQVADAPRLVFEELTDSLVEPAPALSLKHPRGG